ncbi:MAG: glutamate formimidoyltransferase [Firmicutes bacterium]|nr:glutamate formimidoyltransferase [Bacillota bacterium]
MNFNKIIECVPNFSEGRDADKVEQIVGCFRGVEGVKLLDYSLDKDHNRSVVTVAGEPEAVKNAVIKAVGVAQTLIDLTKHEGQHPRMGATDVVPFIPVKNVSDDEANALAKEVGEAIARDYNIPIFFYERSASAAHRENLADIRKGQFEGMAEKMKDEKWRPDCGPSYPHPTAGVTAVGFRAPLVAFNVNLDTPNLDIATAIAKKVRHIGGGLRYCKAMGVDLADRKQTQVSMNLTDFNKTPIYFAVELVRVEARRYGVNVVGCEVVGLVPQKALIDCAEYYLQLENFSPSQVLETKMTE